MWIEQQFGQPGLRIAQVRVPPRTELMRCLLSHVNPTLLAEPGHAVIRMKWRVCQIFSTSIAIGPKLKMQMLHCSQGACKGRFELECSHSDAWCDGNDTFFR
jgi:hypothetical protein